MLHCFRIRRRVFYNYHGGRIGKKQEEWGNLSHKPEIRNRFMFQLFSVDSSQSYIDDVRSRFSGHLIDRVHFHYSKVEIGKFNGQICHYYKKLPNIVPDFIYLDDPSPKDVKGEINGLSFQCDERTVMAGYLLLKESTFLPGTLMEGLIMLVF